MRHARIKEIKNQKKKKWSSDFSTFFFRDCFINILLKHPQVEIEVRDLSMKREEDMNNVLQEIEQLLDIDPNSNFWKKNNPDFASIMRSHRVKQREIRTKSLDLGKRSRPSN